MKIKVSLFMNEEFKASIRDNKYMNKIKKRNQN